MLVKIIVVLYYVWQIHELVNGGSESNVACPRLNLSSFFLTVYFIYIIVLCISHRSIMFTNGNTYFKIWHFTSGYIRVDVCQIHVCTFEIRTYKANYFTKEGKKNFPFIHTSDLPCLRAHKALSYHWNHLHKFNKIRVFFTTEISILLRSTIHFFLFELFQLLSRGKLSSNYWFKCKFFYSFYIQYMVNIFVFKMLIK